MRSARARARGATATDPRRVRPRRAAKGYHREGCPDPAGCPDRARPPPPPSDPDSDSESLGVLARNERRRAEAAADRLPAAPRAAPRRAREPPAEPSSPSPSRNPNPIQIPTSPPRNSQTPRTRTTNPTPSSRRTTRRKRTTTRKVRLLPGGRRGRVRRGDRTRPLRPCGVAIHGEVLAAALGRRRRGGVTDDVWGAGDPRGGARRGQIAG